MELIQSYFGSSFSTVDDIKNILLFHIFKNNKQIRESYLSQNSNNLRCEYEKENKINILNSNNSNSNTNLLMNDKNKSNKKINFNEKVLVNIINGQNCLSNDISDNSSEDRNDSVSNKVRIFSEKTVPTTPIEILKILDEVEQKQKEINSDTLIYKSDSKKVYKTPLSDFLLPHTSSTLKIKPILMSLNNKVEYANKISSSNKRKGKKIKKINKNEKPMSYNEIINAL